MNQQTTTSQTIDKVTSTYDPNIYEWTAPSRSEKGWECPRCGQIWAPWITKCDCSKTHTTITWTCGTGVVPDYVKQGYTTCTTKYNPDIPHTLTH